MCKAYNDWAYEYCQENPERLFFAAMLPMQDPKFAEQEIYRVAAKGCRVGAGAAHRCDGQLSDST
jgi:predicted TIM-barrel fold metal-dependent hydrolase